jgi:2-amino-4-hydroxy-6-hydroxymethyldihydropteridine diphosphokinase
MPLPADELLGDCRLTEAGLAFGSNIGDKPGNIRRALELLESRRIVSLTAISSIYRTPPWGYLEQEDFANACALARTRLPPLDLLKATRQIETDMGRRPTVRWGPRLIDIDILYYGETRFEHPKLTLPHRSLFERGFVLVPLAEIAPDLRIAGRSIKESAAAFAGERIPKWEEKA